MQNINSRIGNIDKDSLIRSLKVANAEQAELIEGFMAKERSHMDMVVKLISQHTCSDLILTVCCVCGIPYAVKDGQGTQGVSHGYCEECRGKLTHTIERNR